MKVKFLPIILAALTLASCGEKDWDDLPGYFANENFAPQGYPYGNNTITCDNLVSIADLKAKYSKVIAGGFLEEITDDIKIRGRVGGNDIESNLYNQVAIQDETGAIMICVSDGSIATYLPFSSEIVVSLKGLWVGGYGTLPQIGVPYTSDAGKTYVSRMNKFLWFDHFRILDGVSPDKVVAKEINSEKDLTEADCAKLVTLKNVTLSEADGKAVFAPDDGSVALTSNCANRSLKEFSAVVVRTSTYANFAKTPMPTGKVNITGIASKFNSTWQILMRSISDIEEVK